jgi:hypothetical protein
MAEITTDIDRGLAFLEADQRPSGEYLVLRGRLQNLADGEELRSIFGTAFVARTLMRYERNERAQRALERARDFLRAERDTNGLWRYFGKGSHIYPDADDTAYALLVLPSQADDIIVIDAILKNRDRSGAVLTWFHDRPRRFRRARNVVDAVVNANVYTLLCDRARSVDDLRTYLEGVLFEGSFSAGTPYYPSPLFFLYAMAGVTDDLSREAAGCIEAEIVRRLSVISDGPVIDAALACAALVACGHGDEKGLTPLLERIRAAQQEDGGWEPAGAFGGTFQGGRAWYGSRALTTALCLQAITPGPT